MICSSSRRMQTLSAAFSDGEDLSEPQKKMFRQMDRATARLAELKGLSQRLGTTLWLTHSASQSALADAKKDLEGVDLPESVTLALEFLSETAEKGVARAKARAKILALVSDKGADGRLENVRKA
ncbi:hypothetical protein CYMTET_42565 [Cymbomonas tetramitiformis]|uniref:Uncharacterized protein n=1 Tax=Cymbomonas tetramitiformis TaxID=36881 RepID=A0AAE0C3X3_9CHLO|nr:hypothetical protein CYMTET_42565 [Cymbomonas tetramitiformis]